MTTTPLHISIALLHSKHCNTELQICIKHYIGTHYELYLSRVIYRLTNDLTRSGYKSCPLILSPNHFWHVFDTETNPRSQSQTKTNLCSQSQTKTNPCSQSQTKTNPCSQSQTKTNPCSQSQTKTNLCSQSQTKTNPCSQSQTKTNPCSQSQTKTNPCSRPKPTHALSPRPKPTYVPDQNQPMLPVPDQNQPMRGWFWSGTETSIVIALVTILMITKLFSISISISW